MARLQFFRSLPLVQPHQTYARGSFMLAHRWAWAVDAAKGRLHGYDIGAATFSHVDLELPMRHWSPRTGGRSVVLSADPDKSTFAVMDGDVAIVSVWPKAGTAKREHTLLSPATATLFKDMALHAGTLWLCTDSQVFAWDGMLNTQAKLCCTLNSDESISDLRRGHTPGRALVVTSSNRAVECDANGNVVHSRTEPPRLAVFDDDIFKDTYAVSANGSHVLLLKTTDVISVMTRVP